MNGKDSDEVVLDHDKVFSLDRTKVCVCLRICIQRWLLFLSLLQIFSSLHVFLVTYFLSVVASAALLLFPAQPLVLSKTRFSPGNTDTMFNR